MTRKSFLQKLGLGIGAAIVAPKALAAVADSEKPAALADKMVPAQKAVWEAANQIQAEVGKTTGMEACVIARIAFIEVEHKDGSRDFYTRDR
jgi:hypothetical protein